MQIESVVRRLTMGMANVDAMGIMAVTIDRIFQFSELQARR
jgi:hypothetical protein